MARSRHTDIIVIGASSGGLEALLQIVPHLPRDLAATIFVVVHVPSQAKSQLPYILNRAGRLPAAHANDKDPIEPGRIYIAPPDFHLLLRKGHVRVLRGPRENNHRPAIDPLFRTAARAYGDRVVGIILSGTLDDGAAGLFAVKKRGGIAIVQNPADALFPDMPRNAMAFVPVDYCIRKREIPRVICELAGQPAPADEGVTMAKAQDDSDMEKETDIEAMDEEALWRTRTSPGLRPSTAVRIAAASFGNCKTMVVCDFAAVSATRSVPMAFYEPRLQAWNRRCGARFAFYTRMPPCRGAFQNALAVTITCRSLRNLKESRDLRKSKPSLSRSCF